MFSDNPEWDFALAVSLHDRIIEVSGGAKGVHDKGLILSALARGHFKPFGEERYTTHYQRAAALLFSVANNHGFRDGNKRTAMALASFYLYQNGIDVNFTNQEYEDVMLWVVADKPSIEEVAEWLSAHSRQFKKIST